MTSTRRSRPFFPFDPDAYQFIAPFVVVGALFYVFGGGWSWLIWGPCALMCLALLAFFRDPPRAGPRQAGAVWSPADGKIVAIEQNDQPEFGPVPGVKIAIFLSVLDCHINRAPLAGTVEKIRYQPGRFLDARDPKSGRLNECNWIFMRCGRHRVTVRQIAGLIARKIVCRVREGQELVRGQRIGLIRMGSRTDLYLSDEAKIEVRVGQVVRGGKTLLARLPE